MPHEIYTHSHHEVVVEAHGRRTAEEAAAFVRHFVSADMRILDVGCGPGSITCGLARWVPGGEVVGIDAAGSVLEHARARARDEGLSNVEFVEGDAYALDFGRGAFDVVYAHQLLQHLGRPVEALRGFRRVVRPGGVIAVRDADYGTMTHHPHRSEIARFFDVYAQVARANGGEPDAGRRLLEWVTEAGCREPVYTTSSWTFATAEERRWWANLWAGRSVVSSYVDRVRELGFSDPEELEAFGEEFRRWAENPSATFSFMHGEVVARA